MKRRYLFAGAAMASLASAPMAFAQTGAPPATSGAPPPAAANPAAPGTSRGLEEVVVTAERRSENLQKVPISVTAVTLEALLTRSDVVSFHLPLTPASHHLLDASIRLSTVNKTLTFISWRNGDLRKLTAFLQDKVMETRHQQLQPTQVQLPAYQLGQDLGGVAQLQYKATNPYTRVPLMMRRRVSRYYS